MIVATPYRFWLGFALALTPILIGAISKAAAAGQRSTGTLADRFGSSRGRSHGARQTEDAGDKQPASRSDAESADDRTRYGAIGGALAAAEHDAIARLTQLDDDASRHEPPAEASGHGLRSLSHHNLEHAALLAAISHLRDFDDDEYRDDFTDQEFAIFHRARRALERRLEAIEAAIEAEAEGDSDIDSHSTSNWSPYTDRAVKRWVTREDAGGEVIWFELGGAASVEWRETPRRHVDDEPPTSARVELTADFITWSSLTPARAAEIGSNITAAAAFAARLIATPRDSW